MTKRDRKIFHFSKADAARLTGVVQEIQNTERQRIEREQKRADKRLPSSYNFEAFISEWRNKNASRSRRTGR